MAVEKTGLSRHSRAMAMGLQSLRRFAFLSAIVALLFGSVAPSFSQGKNEKRPFVEVSAPQDKSLLLSFWSRIIFRVELERAVKDSGLARPTRNQGFYLSPVVTKLTATPMGAYTLIDCEVQILVNRWSKVKNQYRIDTKGSASAQASGSLQVANGTGPTKVGARDCALSVAQSLLGTKVAPFVKTASRR